MEKIMKKTMKRDTCPTSTLKRVCLSLIVLLLASAAMVGVGSATSTNTVYVENNEALNTAIQNVEDNVPTTLVLASGTYIFPTDNDLMMDKIITFFNDTKAVTIDMTAVTHNHQFAQGATLTFEGVTVQWNKQNEGYQGIANGITKVVYKDCTITGTQFMYGDADFIDCIFESGKKQDETNYDGYAVYGRGEGDLTFTDCTFNTGGRAIMLYNDGPVEVNVTLTNCVFYDNGAYTEKPKAAVETGDEATKSSVFRIIFNGCTVGEGDFEKNNSSSPLWGNKNGMPDNRLCVVFVEGDITLGNDKKYDGQELTYTSTATFKRHSVDCSTITDLTPSYDWFEINGGTGTTDAGEYQLKATATTTDGHTVSMVKDGTVTISPATLTLTIDDGQKKAVDENDPSYTYSWTGNISGETPVVNGALSRVAGEKAGTYPISFGTMTLADNSNFKAANYNLELSTEPVYFTITPSSVLRGDGVPATHALTEEEVSQADKDTLNSTIETSYADKFAAGKYFINVSLLDAQGQEASNSIKFIVPYQTLGISDDPGKYEFVVLHLTSTGIETVSAAQTTQGLEIGSTTTSPFAIGYSVKPTPPKDTSSSSSSGSTVWLTETPTPTPTETPTEIPTDTVPTDIPSTQPTETPATPGFGILAALAGLGAVAVLRRE